MCHNEVADKVLINMEWLSLEILPIANDANTTMYNHKITISYVILLTIYTVKMIMIPGSFQINYLIGFSKTLFSYIICITESSEIRNLNKSSHKR